METHIIAGLSLTLLILLLVTWKDRHERRKNEERLIQKTLGPLQTQVSQLEGLRRALADDKNPIAFRKSPPDLFADNPYWHALSSWIREEK